MSEAMRNLIVLMWAVCAINTEAFASSQPGISEETAAQNAAAPTVVFGEAQTPDGKEDAVLVEQPENAPNPLGNPIPEQIEDAGEASVVSGRQDKQVLRSGENPAEESNAAVRPSAAKQLGGKFQNTLMEANGMVYDVQAYPEADLPVIGDPANPETIYSPNVNP